MTTRTIQVYPGESPAMQNRTQDGTLPLKQLIGFLQRVVKEIGDTQADNATVTGLEKLKVFSTKTLTTEEMQAEKLEAILRALRNAPRAGLSGDELKALLLKLGG